MFSSGQCRIFKGQLNQKENPLLNKRLKERNARATGFLAVLVAKYLFPFELARIVDVQPGTNVTQATPHYATPHPPHPPT